MTNLERYQQLMAERPEEFIQSDKGLQYIITDMDVLKDYQTKHPNKQLGVVYESPYHILVVDLLYDGNNGYRTYERILEQERGAVVVIPITPDNKFVLLRQFRHSVRAEQLTFPRGFGTKGITSKENARKETGEEIGADDAKPTFIGEVVANSGLSGVRVKVYVFKIRNYRTVYGNEGIVQASAYTEAEFTKLIAEDEINDGFTLSAYTLYHTKTNG